MDMKDLMIGDWVYDTLTQTNHKVNRGCFETNSLNGICYSENLIPIPLTAEILVKNGWEECNADLDDNDKQYGCTYGKHEITWWRDVKLLGCFFRDKQVGLCYEMIVEMPIKYVHQLQHALRLCGIEKDIRL